jgi:IS30 family transposase
MKLTQKEIENIYLIYSVGMSQRDIAKITGHSRGTVSRHLQTIELCYRYTMLKMDVNILENTKNIIKNKVSLYRNLTIVGFIGFIAQALINLFY